MPEQIRLKVGGVTPQQMAVYEEFARNIPGFLPMTERDTAMFIPKPTLPIEPQPHPPTPFQMPQSVPSDDLATLFEKLAMEVDQFVQATSGSSTYALLSSNMLVIRDMLITAMHNRELVSTVAIIQKVNYHLFFERILIKNNFLVCRGLTRKRNAKRFGACDASL